PDRDLLAVPVVGGAQAPDHRGDRRNEELHERRRTEGERRRQQRVTGKQRRQADRTRRVLAVTKEERRLAVACVAVAVAEVLQHDPRSEEEEERNEKA